MLGRLRPAPRAAKRRLVGLAGIAITLAMWQATVESGAVSRAYLPPPVTVGFQLWSLLRTGQLEPHIAVTLERIGVGLALGSGLGLVLALAAHASHIIDWALAPLVELVRGVPPIALLPAFTLFFGIGAEGIVAIIVWVAWVPVFINGLEGMRGVDPVLLRAARSLGASRVDLILKCRLPAAAPFIVVGLRLGLGSAFLVVVAAEMIGADRGLGFYIVDASQTFRVADMYAAITVIGILGLLTNALLGVAMRYAAPWRYVSE